MLQTRCNVLQLWFRTAGGYIHSLSLYLLTGINSKPESKATKKKKKNTLVYGRTDLPSRVGRSGLFFSKFLVAKIALKTQNFQKKSDFFCRNFWENIQIYFQPKFWNFGQNNGWFYKILANLKKKNLPKWKKWVGRARSKTGFFFVALRCFIAQNKESRSGAMKGLTFKNSVLRKKYRDGDYGTQVQFSTFNFSSFSHSQKHFPHDCVNGNQVHVY